MGRRMTDLLTPAKVSSSDRTGHGPQRPLAVGATVAGAIASMAVLLPCLALGLAGWYASDGGSHGDTTDGLRVGADAWLLAHGARLELEVATITVIPLGLTALCAYAAFRAGRWAGATSAVGDVRSALTGTVSLAGVYAVVAVVTAVLASLPAAQPTLGLAFAGAFTLAFIAGGLGLLRGASFWSGWRARVPELPLAVGTGAVGAALLMLLAGSLLVVSAMLVDFGAAANVLSGLHIDVAGGLLYTVVVAAAAPNAALLGASYLLGPGFAIGAGSVVSPGAVLLGPVPAFPLFAALPAEGVDSLWTTLLATAPVAAAAIASGLMLRRFPVPRYEMGALRGVLSGVLGGVLFTVAAQLAGGSVGPGRMGEVGVSLWPTLVAAVSAMGVGGLVGALAMTWWVRRRVFS